MSEDAFTNVLKGQLAKCYKLPKLTIAAELKVGSYKFKATAVSALSVTQNYHDDMFETAMITVAMSVRHFTEVVLHGHEDIEMAVTTKPANGGGKPIINKYRAILANYSDPKAEGNNADASSAVGAENISIVTFQLLPLAAYNLRLHEVGGTFAKTSAINVLLMYLKGLQLDDELASTEAVSRINVDAEASDRIFREISIQDGTQLLALPDLLQNNYGIFQQGLGCFLQRGKWYVFAPYGIAKKYSDVLKLKIFNAPASRHRGTERTMYLEGKVVNIVATGEVTVSKNSDAEALNGGTGVRYADVKAIAGRLSTSAPADDPKMVPSEYVTEYRASTYAGPYQRTVTASERFTDNPLKHSSQLAKRSGRIIKVVWENGVIDVLVPGMPVSFYYGKDSKVVIEHGTLLGAQAISQIANGGLVETTHITTIELTLFLKAE